MCVKCCLPGWATADHRWFLAAHTLTQHVRWKPGAAGYDLLADDVKPELADVSLQGKRAMLGIRTAQARIFIQPVSASPVTVARLLNEVPSTWMSA